MKKMKKIVMLGMVVVFGLPILVQGGYSTPYTDSSSTTALWHMNAIRDSKYMDDDVSSGRTPAANGVLNPNPTGGPALVTPSVYPGGNSAFGNCLYFDGVNDNMIIGNAGLVLNPADLRIEGWVKTNAAADGQMFIDRWGQMNIYIESTKVTAQTWSATAALTSNSVSPAGWNPTVWNHVAVEIIGTTQKIYINGALEGTFTITGGLSTTTTKTSTYLAQRYSGVNKFAGYMDEVRISQATIPEPATLALLGLGLGGFLIRRKRN